MQQTEHEQQYLPVDALESRRRLARNVGVGAAGAAGAGGALLAMEQPSHADAIANLVVGVENLNSIYAAATPVAVGVIIFGAAVMVVKRLLYA